MDRIYLFEVWTELIWDLVGLESFFAAIHKNLSVMFLWRSRGVGLNFVHYRDWIYSPFFYRPRTFFSKVCLVWATVCDGAPQDTHFFDEAVLSDTERPSASRDGRVDDCDNTSQSAKEPNWKFGRDFVLFDMTGITVSGKKLGLESTIHFFPYLKRLGAHKDLRIVPGVGLTVGAVSGGESYFEVEWSQPIFKEISFWHGEALAGVHLSFSSGFRSKHGVISGRQKTVSMTPWLGWPWPSFYWRRLEIPKLAVQDEYGVMLKFPLTYGFLKKAVRR
jgi:hypothetical protein